MNNILLMCFLLKFNCWEEKMATSEKNSELGNSLLLDDDEVSGYIFSHDKAAESNKLVEQSYTVQVGGTQFSILDMDLCGDSILLPSLPPHHIPPIGGSHKSDIVLFSKQWKLFVFLKIIFL